MKRKKSGRITTETYATMEDPTTTIETVVRTMIKIKVTVTISQAEKTTTKKERITVRMKTTMTQTVVILSNKLKEMKI